MPMIDKYFERKYTKWNIIDFLNECDIETFEGKIDHYLKSLRAIVDYEEGANQDKARYLLYRYNKDDRPGPDYKEARNWEKRTSVRAGSSFHFHNSTITGNSLGGNSGAINNIKFPKERNRERDQDESDYDFMPVRQLKRKKQLSLPKKNKESVYSAKKAKTTKDTPSSSSSSSSQGEPRSSSTPEVPIPSSSQSSSQGAPNASSSSSISSIPLVISALDPALPGNSPEYDKPHTPPHQIRSTSEN